MNIPNVITQIWIGHRPPPLHWMDTWKQKHPHWTYTIFDNSHFNSTTFHNQHLIDEYMDRRIYAGACDLIRYELLYTYGGFIPPSDSICLENTDELWVEDPTVCYTVYENELLEDKKGWVSPIYASNPKNKFVGQIIDHLHTLQPNQLSDKPYETTGNLFLKNFIEQTNPDIKIFPWYTFIPNHPQLHPPNQGQGWHENYSGPNKVYADQQWYSTHEPTYRID